MTDDKKRREQARIRQQQRRRLRLRRIDYIASSEAAAIIDSLRSRYAGGDASSIINRIVSEWWATRQRDGL